jgi:hypothetical protein
MKEDKSKPVGLAAVDWGGAMMAAANTLHEQLTCGNPLIEVRAASAILKFNNMIAERQLRQRLDALERNVTPFSR